MRIVEDAVRSKGGVWPSDDADAVHLYKIDNRYIAGLPGGTAPHICTLTEFVECTRRLRNEPSWYGAPDWAVAKAQDGDGMWCWYEAVPRPRASTFMSRGGGGVRFAGKGEAIGDWRDTLRLRPEEKKVESKDDWHTKGELPPVGTVCRLRFATTTDAVVTITYIGDGVLCYRDEKGMEYSASSSHVELLPLQTERASLIEKALNTVRDPLSKEEVIFQLVEAGMLKMPEDE